MVTLTLPLRHSMDIKNQPRSSTGGGGVLNIWHRILGAYIMVKNLWQAKNSKSKNILDSDNIPTPDLMVSRMTVSQSEISKKKGHRIKARALHGGRPVASLPRIVNYFSHLSSAVSFTFILNHTNSLVKPFFV